MAKKKALIVERIEGEHCQLPDLSNARHWMKATTTEGKWLELQREGVACLYMVLDGFVHEQYEQDEGILRRYSPSQRPTDRWQNMLTERTTLLNAFAKSQGSKERGSALPYGESYARAHHHLRHLGYLPKLFTKQETGQAKDEVEPYWAPELTATATAEEVGRRWADIFAEEARVLRGNDTEQTAALHSLCDYLLAFKVGTGEGADVLARMRRESNGTEALAGYFRCKAYLLQGLEKIASDHSEKGTPKPTTARPAKAKDKEWTTLKVCALFHALLYEAKKTEIVDLSTDAFANDVAIKAGHGGKGCGKRLRRHFHTYRSAKGRMAKDRLNSTVWKRYDEAIGKLGKYPEALALAKQERKKVYQREE